MAGPWRRHQRQHQPAKTPPAAVSPLRVPYMSLYALKRTSPIKKPPLLRGFLSGRYWARTSDPQLVELAQFGAIL